MGWDQGLPGGSTAVASLRCACVRVEGEFMRSGRAMCHITETLQSTFRYVDHSLLRAECCSLGLALAFRLSAARVRTFPRFLANRTVQKKNPVLLKKTSLIPLGN